MVTFIPDGYTRRGYIAAISGLHGSIKFEYRPLLPRERNSINQAVRREKAEKADVLESAALAKQLLSWDCTYPVDGPDENLRGKSMPITAANVQRLVPYLFDKLYMIVSGMDASDPDPESPGDDQDSYAAALLRAAESDEPPGDNQLREQQKN